ncbi:MAG TPA: hypothetical protein VMT98_13785 [Verrucomicrobiae bacterium]|nr:hypothetical protein [Verrucomicrobiae bacterium]
MLSSPLQQQAPVELGYELALFACRDTLIKSDRLLHPPELLQGQRQRHQGCRELRASFNGAPVSGRRLIGLVGRVGDLAERVKGSNIARIDGEAAAAGSSGVIDLSISEQQHNESIQGRRRIRSPFKHVSKQLHGTPGVAALCHGLRAQYLRRNILRRGGKNFTADAFGFRKASRLK